MKAIVYPETLPGVASFLKRRAMRAIVSESRGYSRGRMLDKVYSAEVYWEIPSDLMADFNQWYEVDMLKGQRKGSVPLPCETGIHPCIVKFTEEIKHEIIPNYGYRISAVLQVSGLSPPAQPVSP